MKILKSESFKTSGSLCDFFNKNGLTKDDIVYITTNDYWTVLYYWG